MVIARDKMLEAKAKLASVPESLAKLGADVQLCLEGEGGGSWVLHLRNRASVTDGSGDAQCTLTMAAPDFVELQQGRTDMQQLFFSGRLRVEGDLSLAIKLQSLLEAVR